MANVWGRLTGKAGVCLSTLGPGATNLVTGVADANLDHAPLIALTGQGARNRLHKESHQAIDSVQLFAPITKWSARIMQADTIPEIVRKGFKLAEMEKPGAVHIEMPEDVMDEPIALEPIEPIRVRRPAADHKALVSALAIIRSAKKPLVLAGNGAIRKRASAQLNQFLQLTGFPVVTTFMAKGAATGIPPEQNLGTVGLKSRDHVACVFDAADLVITIGYDLNEYAPAAWNSDGTKPVVHIDFTPAEVDQAYHPQVEVVGDIANIIWALNQMLVHESVTRPNYHLPHSRQIKQMLNTRDHDESFPLKPQRIVAELRAALAPEDILISDVGAHKIWIARHYPALQPNTCIISNGFASMGIALPGAIGAKLACPERTVIAATGDGGFLMNVQELETAVRLKLPIIILVWNDGRYSLIEWKQKNAGLPPFGIEFGNPDFVTLAESFGALGLRVESAGSLRTILERAKQETTRPVVIDCPVDRTEIENLTKELQNMKCDINHSTSLRE